MPAETAADFIKRTARLMSFAEAVHAACREAQAAALRRDWRVAHAARGRAERLARQMPAAPAAATPPSSRRSAWPAR